MLDTIAVKPLSDRKVYFVHRADLMNAQAQNKILKTLEEPPKDVTIFLGVANEASMLATIKSRTRNVYIDLFDEETIYNSMLALGLDDQMSAIAAACSEGQLGKAKKSPLPKNMPTCTSSRCTCLTISTVQATWQNWTGLCSQSKISAVFWT